AITKDILKDDPDRLVISMGDFNDELADKSLKDDLNLVDSFDKLASAFAGSFFAIDSVAEGWAPEEKGTYYYYGGRQWNTLDHILVAAGKRLSGGDVRGFGYVEGSYKRVAPSTFRDLKIHAPQGCEIIPEKKIYQGRRGNRCPYGASDH